MYRDIFLLCTKCDQTGKSSVERLYVAALQALLRYDYTGQKTFLFLFVKKQGNL